MVAPVIAMTENTTVTQAPRMMAGVFSIIHGTSKPLLMNAKPRSAKMTAHTRATLARKGTLRLADSSDSASP